VNRDLGICGYDGIKKHTDIFGGFYRKFRKSRDIEPQKVLDESILNQYHTAYSKRFHDDGISFIAQKKFGIRYDVQTQRIVIPIYNPIGELIGAKGRINYEDDEEEKYLYLIPCKASETLYGYSLNYQDMTGNSVYICESEKSVMQAFSYGMRSFVGLGGNIVSDPQCKLLTELFPRKIVFLLDEGLDMDITTRNIERLQSFTRMLDVEIGYWDYKSSTVKQPKCSPTDLGEDKLKHVLHKEIIYVR
jgi:DNA primase